MKPKGASRGELKAIDAIVREYVNKRSLVGLFQQQVLASIQESTILDRLCHSVRYRTKDPEHLRHKLLHKLRETKESGATFDIDASNVLSRITDLAGIRLLHLHTTQFAEINSELLRLIAEQKYALIEGPSARTWDDEYRAYFKGLGVETVESPSLYTSVHYVIESASTTKITCEIQVRTLMEEVWGEVSHSINYPDPTPNLPCTEQIKVLARVTSSATRLVDSVFATHKDYLRHTGR